MDSELLYTLRKSLEYYDKKQLKFNKLFKNDKLVLNKQLSSSDNIAMIGENSFIYEVLGIFDIKTNVWIWGYAIPFTPDHLKKQSEELHIYSLKQQVTNLQQSFKVEQYNLNEFEKYSLYKFYIKTIFGNSRLLINNMLELEIIIAMSTYLLKDRSTYIYNEEKNNIIYYYILKSN